LPRVDYGQAPAIDNPDIKNARVIRRRGQAGKCTNLKYIDNKYLNSVNGRYKGFAQVGQNVITGNWRIIKVWGYW